MKKHCLDIGIIQAFMDGELAHDRVSFVSGHIAACDDCAGMLAMAEDESAIVFPALEREFNTLVPTQRLWNKINGAIETERDNAPFWTKAWAFFTVSLANPSFTVAAGLLVVVGLVSTLWIASSGNVQLDQTVAHLSAPATSTVVPASQKTSDPGPAFDVKPVAAPPAPQTRNERPTFLKASFSEERKAKIENLKPLIAAPLPGEESYVKTIASLAKTVDSQKDSVMRPGERVAYERDMAVVNDAISKMRKEVKRNPKNDSAKQVLYSSYQNKIDLLNSVSQKEELVASMKY